MIPLNIEEGAKDEKRSNDGGGSADRPADERKDHQAHMRAMKTYDECKTYRDQLHEQMVARAKERGGKALAPPRRDACSGLKK